MAFAEADVLSEIDKAIIGRLRGDATLTGLITGIWEGMAPMNDEDDVAVDPPFIVTRPVSFVDEGAAVDLDSEGFRYDVIVHHQDYSGAVRQIVARILWLLHDKPLTLASGMTNVGIFRSGRFRLPRSGGWVEEGQSFTVEVVQSL